MKDTCHQNNIFQSGSMIKARMGRIEALKQTIIAIGDRAASVYMINTHARGAVKLASNSAPSLSRTSLVGVYSYRRFVLREICNTRQVILTLCKTIGMVCHEL